MHVFESINTFYYNGIGHDWWESLSDEEKVAAKFYKSDSFSINQHFRSTTKNPYIEEDVISYLDSALEKGKIFRDIVWRIQEADDNIKVGDIIEDKGYLSTSLESSYIRRTFKEPYNSLLRIITKKYKGMYLEFFPLNNIVDYPDDEFDDIEEEILFQRGVKLEVQKIQPKFIQCIMV